MEITKTTIPKKGSFEWPGRAALSIRERLLLESASVRELMTNAARMPGPEVGALDALHYDWRRLRIAEESSLKSAAPARAAIVERWKHILN